MATTLFFPVYFWWASGNCSHNFLFLIDRSGTCSCSQSHWKYKGLCFQRCTSSYLGCNEWVFELLLPSCHFISSQNSLAVLVWPLALIRLFFLPRELLLTRHFLFFRPAFVHCRDGSARKFQHISSFWNLHHLVTPTTMSHSLTWICFLPHSV